MRIRFTALSIALVLLAGGCASEPKVLPPTPHAATPADAIKVVAERPSEYELLGTVSIEITPDLKWDERGNANKAFELLKKGAAATGANTLLLWAPPDKANGLATAGYNGKFYQVPIQAAGGKRQAVAQAIFVNE